MNNNPLLDLALKSSASDIDQLSDDLANVATQAINEEPTGKDEVSEIASEQIPQIAAQKEYASTTAESASIQKYGLSQAEDNVRFLRSAWTDLIHQILNRIGDTPENREWLTSITALLQTSNYQAAYFGVQLVELYNYHVNGQRPIDIGSLFVMNDYMRGFKNHIGAIPQKYLNVWDMDTAGASADPRLDFGDLPVSILNADPTNARIPVKVETFTDIMYGYLEMFRFSQMVGDRPMNFVTSQPALRIKDNYVTPNSIFRWCEVDNDTVKNAWNQGRSIIKKKVPSKPTESNPIEDTPTQGSPENENT